MDGERSFGNEFDSNVVTFGVTSSLSSHTDDCKNNFLMLDKGDTFRINRSFGEPGKYFCINFSKEKKNIAWVCIRMVIIVIYLLMKNKSICLKLVIKILTFPLNFV